MSRSWHPLPDDIADVVDVVARLTGESAHDVDLRGRLGELGLWTVGAAEAHGGGGEPAAAAAVIGRLAHADAGLAWAAVQAHAAIAVLGSSSRWDELTARINTGDVGVAVTALDHDPDDSLAGLPLDRVDGGDPHPWVLVVAPDGRAWALPPGTTAIEPVRRTGLAGAHSARARVTGPVPADLRVDDVDAVGVRTLLRIGAALVARGLAEAATGAAERYCAVRHQFGVPLTALAAVRDALYTATRAAGVLELPGLDAGGTSGLDPAHAAALADAACEAAVSATSAALGLHGGYGYLCEYGVERLLRDAVSLRAACDTAAGRREAAAALAAP